MDGHVRKDALPLTEPTYFCRDCQQDLPRSAFGNNRAHVDGRTHYCKSCHSARSQAWKQANPEAANPDKARATKKVYYAANANPAKARDANLRRRYGLTLAEVEALLNEQGGVCKICRTPDWGRRGPFVDHCHVTRRVRGILCNQCNVMLGQCRDSTSILKAAIDYLNHSVD